MKRGFEHVFALERQALGWICHDPSMSDYLSVIMPATWEVDMAQTYVDLNPGSTVVKVFVTKSPQAKYFRWGWINCIGVVQYLLGVYWPWVLTPYRLYLKVLSNSKPHIKVGKLWQAKVQSDKPRRQQRHQTSKQED
jgi:hypothetical protein